MWNDSSIALIPNNGIYSFKQNLKPYQTYIYRNTVTIGSDTKYNSSLKVYPNPTNSNYIYVDGTNLYANSEIIILNTIGQEIKIGGEIDDNRIDISKLNTGMYILIIKTSEGNYRAKFIKE